METRSTRGCHRAASHPPGRGRPAFRGSATFPFPVLFLDEDAVNVAGAAAAGFQAARASGVGEARQRLAEADVLGTIA